MQGLAQRAMHFLREQYNIQVISSLSSNFEKKVHFSARAARGIGAVEALATTENVSKLEARFPVHFIFFFSYEIESRAKQINNKKMIRDCASECYTKDIAPTL